MDWLWPGLFIVLSFVGSQSCPEVCRCTAKKKYGRHIVDCSYQDLQVVPAGLPSNATTITFSVNLITYLEKEAFVDVSGLQALWLSYNEISTIARGTFASLVQLKGLDLSHNQLKDFPWEDLANLTALQQLKLSNNHLEKVPQEAFHTLKDLRALWLSGNRITVLPEGVFDATPLLSFLQISHNPLDCSCKLWWLQRWLENTSVSVQEKESITCATPENLKDLVLGRSLNLECTLPSVHLLYHSNPGNHVLHDRVTLLLHCHAVGKPPPRITWKVQTPVQSIVLHGLDGDAEGIILPDEVSSKQSGGHFQVFRNGSLVISEFSRTEEGVYTCQATNDVGSQVVSLKVALESSGSPRDKNPQKDIQASETSTTLCNKEERAKLNEKVVVVYLSPAGSPIRSSAGSQWEQGLLGGFLLLPLALYS